MSVLKINWGARIAILYLGFVGIIAVLVAGSMRQNFDLVTPDYYGQEIKYQRVIEAGKNQSALSAPVAIHADATTVVIEFPQEFNEKTMTGTVQFYSPVNAAWDKTFPVTAENRMMNVSRAQLRNARYTIKLTWQADGKEYYQESSIDLH